MTSVVPVPGTNHRRPLQFSTLIAFISNFPPLGCLVCSVRDSSGQNQYKSVTIFSQNTETPGRSIPNTVHQKFS